ncbi:MAG: sugar transferase [Candidatus Lokiarchaeota archaeon]|nr:sugar transferase [Candidatus Lokiarchaeota archaeon]
MNYQQQIKPLFDLLVAFWGLVFTLPLFLIIYAMIWLTLGHPVIFRQKRPGLHGNIFTLYKFRTMSEKRDKTGDLLPDSKRLHLLGRFLRKTSLDELPELYNVLKGDMSLVGPRPLLVQYLERYTPEQARRHEVRPGITGLAQISGRNDISWQKSLELDVWYVDHLSFWLDVKILALTLIKVFKAEGISQSGQATREEFQGTYSRDFKCR